MNRHESLLRIAAGSDISVLLLGESGSGKEVAARFIHAHGKRAGGPFIA
jgi:DNA-binding NtrC family response regulator